MLIPVIFQNKLLDYRASKDSRRNVIAFSDILMITQLFIGRKFIFQHEMPVLPNYGEVVTGGCHSFAKDVMLWPQDLIIGGVQTKNGTIQSAEALQSVFLVASPIDIYNRFKVYFLSEGKLASNMRSLSCYCLGLLLID